MQLVTTVMDSTVFWVLVLFLAAVALAVIRAIEANMGFLRKRDELRRARDPEQRRAWAGYLGERAKEERLRKERKG